MDRKIIEEIKKKREFSDLPDSIVLRFAEIAKGDVKESRAQLRKYFGVFLTNRVLKSKGDFDQILKAHISSKKRDYLEFYNSFTGERGFNSILDLGSGVNGFSYPYLTEVFGEVKYYAIEASGQLVRNMNDFFEKNHFDGQAIKGDLMDFDFVGETIGKIKDKKLVFLFQVVDALENLEKNSSKKFLEYLLKYLDKKDLVVLTVPTESIGGRKRFFVLRKWLLDFLNERFSVEKDFDAFGERIIVFRKK